MSYLPNILSILRLLLSPVFFVLIISKNTDLIIFAYFIYIFAAITDYFDGVLARKYNATSQFGNFFDPLADKFLTSFAFMSFVNLGIINIWLVIIVIFRDLFTTIMRIYKFNGKAGIITSKTAKWKTFIQMVFIFYILTIIALYNSQIIEFSTEFYTKILYSEYIDILMLIITILSVWTLIDYGVSIFAKSGSSK